MCNGAIVMDIAMSNGNGSSLKGAGVGTRAASLTIFSIMISPCAVLNCIYLMSGFAAASSGVMVDCKSHYIGLTEIMGFQTTIVLLKLQQRPTTLIILDSLQQKLFIMVLMLPKAVVVGA